MTSLDDIVLVSFGDFASTYSSQRHLKAAVRELACEGITFPITYNSPFFQQLARLAVLVYFKGTVVVQQKEAKGFDYSPAYAASLYVPPKLGNEWVKRKLEPYFSAAPDDSIGVGSDGTSHLNRPLARILHCLEIPTNDEHLTAKDLPTFMTELSIISKSGNAVSRASVSRVLIDMYESFLRVKTTFVKDFYWQFFLPIKESKETASNFRRNMTRFLQSVFPEVKFKELGEPRKREGGSKAEPISYYDSILALGADSVKTLLSNYGSLMDMDDFFTGRPALSDLYVRATKGTVLLTDGTKSSPRVLAGTSLS